MVEKYSLHQQLLRQRSTLHVSVMVPGWWVDWLIKPWKVSNPFAHSWHSAFRSCAASHLPTVEVKASRSPLALYGGYRQCRHPILRHLHSETRPDIHHLAEVCYFIANDCRSNIDERISLFCAARLLTCPATITSSTRTARLTWEQRLMSLAS